MAGDAKRNSIAGFPGARFDVVAMAASLGGLDALSRVLSRLPAGFPAAVLVVLHLEPHRHSEIANILGRRLALQTKQAEAGERVRPGTVYVAPPDWHLLAQPDGTLALSHAEKVNFSRPAGDVLFESVAGSYGARAIGVVLTGGGRDGAAGTQAIKRMGGATLAQDAASAAGAGMPDAALATGAVDRILPVDEIGSALVALVLGGEAV